MAMEAPTPTAVVKDAGVRTAKIDAKHGQVDGSSPVALKQAGNSAVKAGDWQRAIHMFTLGIDMIVGTSCPTEASDWYALDKSSSGVLHLLCSNRSLAYLTLEDVPAAAEDAEHACFARPDFAKGHLRLLAALEAAGAPVAERLEVCSRGLRACPSCKDLRDAKSSLDSQTGCDSRNTAGAEEAARISAQMTTTKLMADAPSDPRHAMAAGDYGSALALGAHGVRKDVEMAAHYLKVGAEGGDAGAQRSYGMLLLEQGDAGTASDYLRRAADQGDEESVGVLKSLQAEAEERRKRAMFKLRALASNGDARAVTMLKQFEEGSVI